MDPRTANDALFDQAELLGFLYVHWRTLHKSRLISFRTLAPHRGGGEGRGRGEACGFTGSGGHLTWQAFHQPFHVGFDRKHR